MSSDDVPLNKIKNQINIQFDDHLSLKYDLQVHLCRFSRYLADAVVYLERTHTKHGYLAPCLHDCPRFSLVFTHTALNDLG